MSSDNTKQKKEKRTWLYGWTAPIAGLLVKLPFGLKVIKGKNNIPAEGAAIAAGNHIHFADPIFLYFAQKRQLRFMAKAELFKNPVLGWICKGYGAFPVERGTGDTESVNTAFHVLEEGKVLGIFPEGTRSKSGVIGRGKTGTIHIAHQSGAPIYPFAVFSQKSALRIGSRYTIAYGEPVTAADLGVVEGTPREYRNAIRKLMSIICELQDDCREYRGLPRIYGKENEAESNTAAAQTDVPAQTAPVDGVAEA